MHPAARGQAQMLLIDVENATSVKNDKLYLVRIDIWSSHLILVAVHNALLLLSAVIVVGDKIMVGAER